MFFDNPAITATVATVAIVATPPIPRPKLEAMEER